MKKLLLLLLILSAFATYAQVPSYVPTNGLVGYWPFNGNANDESGNGNNGVVNGATLTTDRFGNANGAYSFNGISSSITISNTFFDNGWLGNTIGFWFNPTNNNTSNGCILNTIPHDGTAIAYSNYGTNKKLYYSKNSDPNQHLWNIIGGNLGNAAFSFPSFDFSNWYYITIVKSNNTYTYYVNGSIDNTVSSSVTPTSYMCGMIFGNLSPVPVHPSEFLNGKLDDIAIYNRALSPQEITQLYTGQVIPSYVPTNGLVAYYPFNGNADDASGNGNNGTVNGATLTTDRFGNVGKAYSFDGISNYIGTSYLGVLGANDRTVSFWAKQSESFNTPTCSSCSRRTALSYGSNVTGPSQIGKGFYCEFNIGLTGICFDGNETAAGYSTPSSVDDNNWHLYSFVLQSVSNVTTVKVYQDGTLLTQRPYSYLPSFSINTIAGAFLDFGRRTYNTQSPTFYKGSLDDISIYNRALSATEVQNLYNASAPTSCIANIINNDTTICKGQSLTLNADAVASGSVTDINGNAYPTVNIGSQTWMQKNLNVSKYKNGDVIPQVTDASQWAAQQSGAWCWYNNDSATYATTYGKLYNWYAVIDPRGLAPDGWHVPYNSEWINVSRTIENDPNYYIDTTCAPCGESCVNGAKLKEQGTSHWVSPNSNANNLTGFKALPAGLRTGTYLPGTFQNIGAQAWFWTKSLNIYGGVYRYLVESQECLWRGGSDGAVGGSVRCLKDQAFPSPTFLWSTGATTQSITVSPTVTTTYYLTVTDANGNTCRDSVKVFVNTAIPSAPATLTGATDVCPYFSSTTSATSNAVTYTAATVSTASSYTWTVPAGVTIVSGQGTNSITVTFASTFVSGAITVKSVNACGSSTSAKSLTVYKRVAATPGVIQKEFSPTSIAAVTNVTGLVSETYRIKKVTYATSYNWSMNQGTSATITHINPLGVNDTAVIVTFANCFLRDTLSVKSVTPCSVSAARTAILVGYTTPAAVSGITTVGGNFATCIGVNKTFTAVRGTPTTSQAPIASFRWTRPANTSIVSATSDSASITVSFNTGYTGGSISAKGVSQCGTIGTTASTAILQFLPPSVLSIASSTGSYNACIGNSITYSALVGAPTTSQVAASVFRWTKPNNTSITSASADSSTITLQFNTGYIGGTLSVRGQTSCGTQGTAKTQTLTHAGCAAGTKMSVPVTTTETGSFEISLYPNPSAGEFKLFVGVTPTMATNLVGGKTPTKAAKATVKIIDLQGRLIKSFECNANQVTALGNELKPGVYMVEVRMGNEVKTVRAVRF